MRKSFVVFTALLGGLMVLYACGRPVKSKSAVEKNSMHDNTIPNGASEDLIDISLHVGEWWYPSQDTIVGNWDGKGLDTLVSERVDTQTVFSAEEYDWYLYNPKWRVRSLSGRLRPLEVDNTVVIRFIKEGDLDGNGTDEFGYQNIWPTSNLFPYFVLTYRNSRWVWLVEPISCYSDHFDAESTIERSKRRGYMKVRFDDWRNETHTLVDTLVKPQFVPIQPLNE